MAKTRYNPLSEDSLARLQESIDWSLTQIKPFREKHFEALRYFAGDRYGDRVTLPKVPINMIHLAVEVWLRQLAAQTPRTLVLTRNPINKTAAYELEIALDYTLREINFGSNLAEAVMSAIFSLGVMKVGITSAYLHGGTAFTNEAGHPYAESVMFEDWFHDMGARRQEEWDYCGNRYYIPYEQIMDNKEYKNKEKLKPDGKEGGGEGLLNESNDSGVTVRDFGFPERPFRERVGVRDVWLPWDKLLVTIPIQKNAKPILIKDWKEPERGPYHLLSFLNIPGNILPTAPIQHLYEIQDLITRLTNKTSRQALAQKTVIVADGRAAEDGTAERVIEAEDLSVIRTSHIDGIKDIAFGGADQRNIGMVVWLKELFSYLGGNLDVMGGLAQQGGTLGQEQLLVQSSSEMLRNMQSRVIDYVKGLVKDLAWYLYSDPLVKMPLVKSIEGFGDIPFLYKPSEKTEDFFDFSFDIQPYSLQYKGPSQRLQTILSLFTTVILPMAPQFESWGISINFKRLFDLISRYSDLPEFDDLITSELPTPYENYMNEMSRKGGGTARKARQSPVTQRKYTRENVNTGGTAQNQSARLMQSLMSIPPQQT